MPTPTIPSFSAARVRSYIFRLPLFTRGVLVVIVACSLLGIQSVWDLRAWGALIPEKTGLTTLYRVNTFPFIHLNIFHTILNILALTPLLERFESEYGTLTSLALFLGPLSTLPAFLYLFFENVILGANTAVMGASVWVFLLLGIEALRAYRLNPYFVISTYSIPTWITPLAVLVCVSALIPSTSFLGHLCGLSVGYLCGLGLLKYLAPPEKALRWIEGKLNLLGRLPHYVSVDQKTYGRFGVIPMSNTTAGSGVAATSISGPGQRLGP